MVNTLPHEVEQLHALGLAVHWLREKSKIPVDSKWTSGPRLSLPQLKAKHSPQLNPGVRLGAASKVGDKFLAVLDIDVKSKNEKHRKEAMDKLFQLFPEVRGAPCVLSGRGNGSAHYYVLLKEPLSGDETKGRSETVVKVFMPSVPPSKRELKSLPKEDVDRGARLRPAWEISLLSEGRQVALPGAIHPDTGKPYVWGRKLSAVGDLPLITPVGGVRKSEADDRKTGPGAPYVFVKGVTPEELGLRPDQCAMVREGDGAKNDSNDLFAITLALVQRKTAPNLILSLLTDPIFYLGKVAYRHADTKNRQVAARWIERYGLGKAERKVNSDTDFDIVEVTEEPKPKQDTVLKAAPEKRRVLPQGIEKIGGWEDNLELGGGGKGMPPVVKPTYLNIRLILGNKCERDDFLRRDMFRLADSFMCDTPWGNEAADQRAGGDEDALIVKRWLSDTYGMECSVSRINEVLNTVAIENKFHPLKDYLDRLRGTWDGVPRVDTALKVYLNAVMPEPYLSDVSRKFFMACVKRVYRPGIKFDYMVILEGNQGLGKSTFPNILASDQWFLDGLPNLHDKDAALYLLGTWICEFGELAELNASALGIAKRFISRKIDSFRPPYGHRRMDFKRSTTFIGSVDKMDYLTDPAGNRRYWPVWCNGCEFKKLERDRDQLWAEAMFLMEFFDEPLYLEGTAKDQAVRIQDSRRVEDEGDAMKVDFDRWTHERIKEGKPFQKLLMRDLFMEGPFSGYPFSKANTMRAGDVLREAGYEKRNLSQGKFWVKVWDF